MTTITIHASKEYQVIIGNGLQKDLGMYAASVSKAAKVAIVSDSNVWPLYGKTAQDSLLSAGFAVCSYVFSAGEASKNGETYLRILDFLAQNHITRTDLLIALGGGVVGDITGFAAATYLRGISYIQIPTSLLAMVDSSVGGKTAIDLPSGKNLAGAFYQPNLVLCDIDALNTLPADIFRDGCAEVIKYGVLFDSELFEHLYACGLQFNREYVVARCVELKRDVVAQDEFDRGLRQKLNLGHTIGHSIEANSNFTVSHGQAVAIGMAIVSKAGCAEDVCTRDTYEKVLEILKIFTLPCRTHCSADALYHSALSDKKRAGGTVNLIIPRTVGDCIIRPTPIDQLKSFIEAGL